MSRTILSFHIFFNVGFDVEDSKTYWVELKGGIVQGRSPSAISANDFREGVMDGAVR